MAMFFKRRTIDEDTIVEHLASLGINKKGQSLFLDSEEISRDLILDFLTNCTKTEKTFRFAENVLRLANAHNAISVLLNLKDNGLERHILARLRDPSLFLRRYGLDTKDSQKKIREEVERGYGLFIDNLEISERLIVIGAHEILASRFMNYLSDGKIGKEDDQKIWLAFALGIYNHLKTLPPAITKAKQKLRLK